MNSNISSRRSFLAKTGLVLGAAALGQVLPEGVFRLAGKPGLWLPEAYAGPELLGPALPVVTVVKTGNTLQFLILSALYANKGIINAADNDRFVIEAQAYFFNAQTGGFIGGTGAQEFGVKPDTDTELRKGSTIKVVPLTLAIPAESAALVETVLRGGSPVTYQVAIALVLTDAAGGRHTLGSVTTTGSILPDVSLVPTITPAAGTNGDPFVIRDPEGRMAGATIIVFFAQGQGPEQGTFAQGIEFSADGTEARGKVPGIDPGSCFVTVHMASVTDPPLFNALAFAVT